MAIHGEQSHDQNNVKYQYFSLCQKIEKKALHTIIVLEIKDLFWIF
jgi:hypothetical protein